MKGHLFYTPSSINTKTLSYYDFLSQHISYAVDILVTGQRAAAGPR